MGPFSFLRSIYNVDTLDTRFTTPSSVPYKAVVEARAEGDERPDALNKPDKRAQPSKWGTAEFYLYYFVFLTVVPYMFWIAYDVSRRMCVNEDGTDWTACTVWCWLTPLVASDPRYQKYEEHLSPGWIPGRKIVRVDYLAARTSLTSVIGRFGLAVRHIPTKPPVHGHPSDSPPLLSAFLECSVSHPVRWEAQWEWPTNHP